MIVIDAGVWVRALVDLGPEGVASRAVLVADPDWLAPAHCPVEVLRTIRRYESADLLSTEDANVFAAEVFDSDVVYVGPERWVLESVWLNRFNISPYDVPYVALALHRGIPLVTVDRRLARAAAAAGADVVVPGVDR